LRNKRTVKLTSNQSTNFDHSNIVQLTIMLNMMFEKLFPG